MAKRNVTTKERAEKQTAARQKVDELLEDVIPTKKTTKKPKVTAKKAETAKNVTWLEKEVERLTQLNTELENKLIVAETETQKSLNELNVLKQSGANLNEGEIKTKVVEHFRDLEDAFLGRNAQRTRYQNTTVQAQLDKMVTRFPFLKALVTRTK
jgi:hypothetical protein